LVPAAPEQREKYLSCQSVHRFPSLILRNVSYDLPAANIQRFITYVLHYYSCSNQLLHLHKLGMRLVIYLLYQFCFWCYFRVGWVPHITTFGNDWIGASFTGQMPDTLAVILRTPKLPKHSTELKELVLNMEEWMDEV